MQPMAAGARRSLIPGGPRNAAEPPNASAHWPRDQPLAALTPEDETPPLQRREFGAEGLRESTVDDSNGTPAEVRAGTVYTCLDQRHIRLAGGLCISTSPKTLPSRRDSSTLCELKSWPA